MLPDKHISDLFTPLEGHNSVHSPMGYRKMTGNFSLSKPSVTALCGALDDDIAQTTNHSMDIFLAS